MEGQLRILSIFAFIVVDDDGSEGVIAVHGMPLVGADLARVALLRPVAQQVAGRIGKSITLAHFSVRTDQEVLTPSAAGGERCV